MTFVIGKFLRIQWFVLANEQVIANDLFFCSGVKGVGNAGYTVHHFVAGGIVDVALETDMMNGNFANNFSLVPREDRLTLFVHRSVARVM